MQAFSSPFSAKSDSAFDDLSASLGDPRPHPTEDALVQLGRALMTELLDVIADTALEDFQNDIVETYGPHNTILDNCAVYTAFSALDPLTQEKVSKLTGSVAETRTSRSAPAGLAAGRSSVSRTRIERPLLEPGEIRALADDRQLVFVAGRRPLRTHKLQYDRRAPFRGRAAASAPDQAGRIDTPGRRPHPWAGRRGLGEDAQASLPLFKEVAAAMDDKKAAARAADIYGRVAQEMAAQQAALDQLQGLGDDQD
ncbi:MAG: type IV secretory system conjugative DNA transfer family protein [Brevundimonas sp.]|uniref:type IV secretory system conjugative DNA transfer family protein n=1 Tax=Brevundimonas sp. TaxID=1871086 RepID=UPI00248751D1|nr:type IV secretory system conjugative DNA transfer family protein [Brevundimonas sp.]MDI1326986.1 type IV secretory system conjugative DNA transfer family protein [Brevundimonas sp.]